MSAEEIQTENNRRLDIVYREKNVAEFSTKHGLNSSHVYECLDGKAKQHKGWTFMKR